VTWVLCARQRETTPPYPTFTARRSLDEPSWTITALGVANARISQCWLEDDGMTAVAPAPERPAYRLPSMDDVRAVPWNGLRVASVFCGAGGSSTGYRMAGYRVLAGVEADYTVLLRRDVRGLGADELLDACGLAVGELDVLDGSPPCEPFSTAGKRDKTWNRVRDYSGQRQRTDDLFFEYARLVDGVRPRVFVAENVTGLVKGRAKGYFKQIMVRLRELGYRVQARTLDASWLGVPQARQRVIIIGVRDDLGAPPVFPEPQPHRFTVRDAIADLLPDDVGLRLVDRGAHGVERFTDVDRKPSPTVCSLGMGVAVHSCVYLEQVTTSHGFDSKWKSLDEPATTILAEGPSTSGVLRANGRRRHLTIPEVQRICAFPDDYVLTGSFQERWERLGDAVPPPMAAAWARALAAGPLGPAGP
jgi:DNA (cytosine-5)-methyltransferase 1